MATRCLGLVAAAAILLAVGCTAGKGNFSLVNKSTEPIMRASVTICGQLVEFEDLQSDHSAAGRYAVKCEGHYVIEIEFRSGRKLRKELGYVTSGMDFQDEITVFDTDVVLTATKGIPQYSK